MIDTPGARTRAEQLRQLHAELASLLRAGLRAPSAPVLLATERARLAERTVTISLAELHALLRASAPPSAHDAPTRQTHALLTIAARHLISSLAASRCREVPAATIRAAIILLDVLRAWLALNNVVVMRRDDAATATLSDRAREPAARLHERRLPRRSARRS